jgi:hypothetical protein
MEAEPGASADLRCSRPKDQPCTRELANADCKEGRTWKQPTARAGKEAIQHRAAVGCLASHTSSLAGRDTSCGRRSSWRKNTQNNITQGRAMR